MTLFGGDSGYKTQCFGLTVVVVELVGIVQVCVLILLLLLVVLLGEIIEENLVVIVSVD